MEALMKRIVLVFVAGMQLCLIHAQDDYKKMSFQINPVMLMSDIIMGTTDQEEEYMYIFCFEFQYAINKYWNFIIRPNIFTSSFTGSSFLDMNNFMAFFTGSPNLTADYGIDSKIISFGIMPGILYRPFGTGLEGMYLGLYPNIGWEKIKYREKEINDSFFILGIGMEIGYEWIFKNGFTMTLGGGLGKNWGIGLGEISNEYKKPGNLFSIRINFMLGYSF
jgi:hypothetical protein